jgi:hypothetical protein
LGAGLLAEDAGSVLILCDLQVELTLISFMVPSGRFVDTAAACEAFLFTQPLKEADALLAFSAAAARLADIRRAM